MGKSKFRVAALTDSQEKALDAFRDEWIAVGLSVEPSDRAEAEHAIKVAYKTANLEMPKIKWQPSPLAAMISIEQGKPKIKTSASVEKFEPVLEALHTDRIAVVKKGVEGNVAPEVIRIVEARVRDAIGARMDVAAIVGCEVINRIAVKARAEAKSEKPKAGSVAEMEGDANAILQDLMSKSSQFAEFAKKKAQVSPEKVAEDNFMRACLGPFEAGYFGYYDYMHRVLGVQECKQLSGLFRAARSCGMFWPFQGRVIVTERPSKIVFDEAHKVHSADGSAVEYSDGFNAYAWHGVRVPEMAILTPNDVDWPAVETVQDRELKEALAEVKAWKWGGGAGEEYEAALAAKRLGGTTAVKDLTEDK